MNSLQLLTFIVAFTFSLALYHRRRQLSRRVDLTPTIKIRDPAVAREALIEQGVTFANRPATPFPVPLIGGRRRRHSHGITTVAYGPHWRALRSNLTATIIQPWRQGLLAPLQQDAVDALIVDLSTRGAGGNVVIIRDSIYPAVFAMLTRVCFGDDVDESHVRSMESMMQEFRVAIGEAKVLARSTMAKLMHWRKWRRFLAFRSQQVALFVPLIAARRRRRRSTDDDDNGGGGVQLRPYVDSLIDLRIPDENDPKIKRALTEDEMVSLMVEFLGAVESMVAVLEWTLAHLVTGQPEIQTKLRHEVIAGGGSPPPMTTTYLRAVVLEILRLHPPFPLVMREVRSEATAVTVPPAAAGTRVQFILGDIGKDKRVWTDPDEFRPERFLAGGEGEDVSLVPVGHKEMRMMPFGAGHRACPGAAMGVQLIESFLTAMVREFEWKAPPEVGEEGSGGGVDMTELYGFITVMKSPLRTHITRRV